MGAQSATCLLSDCSRPLMRAAAYRDAVPESGAAGQAPAQLSPCQLNAELTPLAHAGKKRALLGTLLRRYLKPGGSGIFLLDIHCYDPPEWCARASLCTPSCAPPTSAACTRRWPAPQTLLAHSQVPDARVRRSLLVADTDQIAKGRRTGVRAQLFCRPQCTLLLASLA